MATQDERRARTRSAIIDAAHGHFVESGYTATSVSDILAAAQISRGAMYHHFASKEDVFAAVFVRTSNGAIRSAAQNVRSDATPFDSLLEGCLAWLHVVSDPTISRLLFTEGPVALGWQRCRALEEASSLGVMRAGLTAAAEAGQIEVESIDVAARLINALLAEAALLQSDPGADQDAIAHDLTTMIRGLAR